MTVVMVVDDEEDFLYEVRRMLEKEGMDVVTASSGKEALEIHKGQRPDLILLDVMMPEMDGWTVAKMLKRDGHTRDITLAMLTVKSTLEDKIQSLEDSMADWHIAKPIKRERFIDTVKWLLENPPVKGAEAEKGEVKG
ncbi:MAG: response regulator [Methanobacteriota archaeon]|nr:MAG: response regulator [Euryarchaeota archaeon]